MRLVVLSEAKAGKDLASEHGLSYYIEHDHKKILFDTGASDLFKSNARKLGIDLESIDLAVLSHGHFDHGDGLIHMGPVRLYSHPGSFVNRYRKNGFGNLGLNQTLEEIEKGFDLRLCWEPCRISEHIIFLGEIPRVNDFEAKSTPYVLENGDEDFVMDDSGLVCITEGGLVVISGCAHSGICNMITHAVKTTGIREIRAVIGGFHLKKIDTRTERTVEFLKTHNVQQVLPSHCTMEPALSLFYKEFGHNEVVVGQELLWL
jgi:7,8-dihydropterin-6-yl-methyl-4-(beta-D-ribofuranosyl)aminobenzene 5'-phosphate synthase